MWLVDFGWVIGIGIVCKTKYGSTKVFCSDIFHKVRWKFHKKNQALYFTIIVEGLLSDVKLR